MNLILDASVIIKWFVQHQEQDRKQAIWIRNQLVQGKLRVIVPDLIFYEIVNALKMKRGVEKSDLRIIIKILFQYPLEIVWPTEELMKNASLLAYENDLTIYDSIYLALAQDLDCPLITADIKLSRNTKPVKVKLLRDFQV